MYYIYLHVWALHSHFGPQWFNVLKLSVLYFTSMLDMPFNKTTLLRTFVTRHLRFIPSALFEAH